MTGNRVLWIAIAALGVGLFASVPVAAAAAAVEPPTLSVILSPREIQVGDLVEAVVSVEQDARDGAPAFPDWPSHWGGAEIREIGEVTRTDSKAGGIDDSGSSGRVRYSQTLALTAFRPGVVELPPLTIALSGDEPIELVTEPATFEVVSVLPAGDEELESKPPAPPRPLPMGREFWWTAGLFAALAAALLALLLRRRAVDATFAGEQLDPWAALEAALARLAEAADSETAFTGLSLELRRYLGRTLAFPAAESTTTELRRRLLRSGLPQSVCGDVVRLLVEADTVKFARQEPAPGRVLACLDQARLAAAEVRQFLQPTAAKESSEEAA